MLRQINYNGAIVSVTETGDVFWNGKQRRINYNKDGYSVCSIKTDKGWRSVRVARLVAIAYIPNPNNLPEVNHKDYDRANSNVENLEWISRIDNVRYSKCNMPDYHGKNNPNFGNNKLSIKYQNDKSLSKEKQSRPKLQNGRCRRIKLCYDGNVIKQFDYIEECCDYLIKNSFTDCKTHVAVRSKIDSSIKNNRPYKKHLTFIKE